MSKSLALLALVPAAQAAYSWTAGTKMCAGIISPCDSAQTCSATAIGPCPGDATKEPTAYLESIFQGFAYINSKQYLDPTTGKMSTTAGQYKIIDASGPGFRDYAVDQAGTETNSKYAYSMVGNVFGDMAKAGGYGGVVSYLNTGNVDIKTDSVSVTSANTGDVQKDKSSESGTGSKSTKGAPRGPFKVCISEIKDGVCGDKRTFKVDEYKFSVYGFVTGPDYATTVKSGVGGYPTGMDKLGVRMKLKAVGFKVQDLKVNGKKWDKTMVNDDVDTMFIMHEKGGLNIKFPKRYNVGSVKNIPTTKILPITASHDMHIRVSDLDTTTQTMYVDYLFDTKNVPAETWFLYDPDVTEAEAGTSDPNAEPEPEPETPAPSTAGDGLSYTVAATAISGVIAVTALLM